MENKGICSGKQKVINWTVLFAVIFVLSLAMTGYKCKAAGNTYRVQVAKGYLALRTEKNYDEANEIGELYSGNTVEVLDYSDSSYWYVYAAGLGKYGYVNKDYLSACDTSCSSSYWMVSVDKGYLALRSAKSYDEANEIGKLYTGDTVQVCDSSDSAYWYVYSSKYGKYGYVNKNYLVFPNVPTTTSIWGVRVNSGYLALRSAKSYDASNEIGKLYNGDIVEVRDTSDSAYWYVYSSKYGKYGYVNKDYLYRESVSANNISNNNESRIVNVSKGYLALRSARSYDEANEIGELYTGDTVQLIDTSDSAYWYVYAPKLGKTGYVNKDYLVGGNSYCSMTVSVAKGYLALRTEKSYEESNEIGELYTGDIVQVMDTSDTIYWYVYAPKLNKYGYVNSDYLY
ncbi:MAG: SH3 domain-containing protein [Blautia sp.]|nr:SH3 domain-containing protein [Blautia sp.]